MAQSTLVSLTVDYQGSTYLAGATRGFDINNFASPLRVTSAGTIVRYVEGGSYSIKQNEPSAIINYTVQESLAAIALVTEGAVVLTVEKRGVTDTVNETFLTPESMLFDVNKIAGTLIPTGTGCGFYYREAGSANPIYYLVSESLSTIIAAVPVGPPSQLTGPLTSPFIPYATGATTLSDSPLSVRNDGGTINVMIARGSSLRSDVAGEAQIWFGAASNSVHMYTDGTTGAECFFEMYPTVIGMYESGGTGKMELAAAAAYVFHTTEVVIQAPLATFVGADFTMQNGTLNLAAATNVLASLNIAAGVAPAAPADGDIWFDGTDVKIRVGGVTKTFTIV